MKFFKNLRERQKRNKMLCQKHEELSGQVELIQTLCSWHILQQHTAENLRSNPFYFREFFELINELPFDDIPNGINTCNLFYFDSIKQKGEIILPWEDAYTEYLRMRAIDSTLKIYECFINCRQATFPFLQALYWARQNEDFLWNYLISKKASLEEQMNEIETELFS